LLACRPVVSGFAAMLAFACVLLFASTPALAAPPETPEVAVESPVPATRAVVRGVLNPQAAGEGGTYEFLYKASKTECEGGSHAPMSPGLSLGLEHEEVSEELVGLEPGTEYTLCLRAENTKGEPAVSPPVTFTTALPPETPETKPATEVTSASATLNGTLNPGAPGEAGTYEFLYRASATECEGAEGKSAPEPVGTTPGMEKEAVSVGLMELLPTTQYTFCLLARNQAGETAVGPPETFTTPAAAPALREESFFSVGSTTATMSAQIAPGGLPTQYYVEYGTSVPYSTTTAALSLPASTVPVGVQQHLSGLQADTEYHFRFSASNSLGTVAGGDVSFATTASDGASAQSLPDNRAYELVSSVGHAEVYFPPAGFPIGADITGQNGFRAAAGGDAVAYLAEPPSSGVGGSGTTGNGTGDHYLAIRGGEGWGATDIVPPYNAASSGVTYYALSADLALETFIVGGPVIAEPQGTPECLAQRRAILYSYTASGSHALPAPPGQCSSIAAGISADDSHILLAGFDGAIYDVVGGQLHQVDVLPSGEPQPNPNAVFGGGTGPTGTAGSNGLTDSVSADGSRVFWTDLNTEVTPEDPAGTTRLFVRKNDTQPQSPIGVSGECTVAVDACTVQLDAPQGGTGSGGGQFWTASGDGATVFFTDESNLTPSSTATAGEPDLYAYDVNSDVLTDLTGANPSSHANVQGVIGASRDGAYVYFVADGVLTKGANAEAKEPSSGQPNLYLFHNGGTTFIATLAGTDGNSLPCPGNSQCGDWVGNPGLRTAAVAGQGHRLAFMSQLSLTGYDNRAQPEVFVYEADAARLRCASCSPSGSPPVHMVDETDQIGLPIARGGFATVTENATFMTRWITDDGTDVFFNTSQALVPQDTNGRLDVYEWESDGAGSCRRNAGCIYLLSSGTSASRSEFVDASASGNDVFFITRAVLVPQGAGEVTKLYDARVGGGFPAVSLACSGAGCQGVPPAPPSFATPSTATFNGTGNFSPTMQKTHAGTKRRALTRALKACRTKRNRHKRIACERLARKHYGARKSSSSGSTPPSRKGRGR
jgi:hypothetical protein